MIPHAWQLAAAEAYERLGGVFIGLDPGAGKTYALARIAARCRRPLVLAPAAAVAQTRAAFEAYGVATASAKHDPRAGHAAFASYTWLTRADQADFFERFAPTDVLMDEYHEARGLGNSARRRLERYLVANPGVRVAVSTGSPYAGGPVHDFAFGMTWALRSLAPVPALRAGVDALDERLARSSAARAEFRRRLESTPGLFLDVGDVGRYEGEVVLRVIRCDPVARLPDTWETPSGYLIESAAHAAEVEKMLAWGYYLDQDPRPSDEYVAARRTWGAVVRRAIQQGLADTAQQVEKLRPKEYLIWVAAQNEEYKNVFGGSSVSARKTIAGSGGELSDNLQDTAYSRPRADGLQHIASAINSTTGASRPGSLSCIDAITAPAVTRDTSFSERTPTMRTTPRLRGAGLSAPATENGSETQLSRRVFIGEIYETAPVWLAPHIALPPLSKAPTLVWAKHRALQDRAAEVFGCPLFREGARSSDGTYLPDYRGACAVASIEACHQSLNLQHFSHSLVLEPPSDPEVWRQLIGRTARQGQTAPWVTVDIVVNCEASARALRNAIDKAQNVYETTGKRNPLLQLKGKI